MARKTANEKLNDSKDMPKVVEVTDPKQIERYGGTKMLIAPPLAYNALMKIIPEGRLGTADNMRRFLAVQHGADWTCPLTAGIFINIVAAASEERSEDKIPYWRTLRTKGELNPKYPGGIDKQKAILEKEGHVIIQKGKRYFVDGYEDKLYDFEIL